MLKLKMMLCVMMLPLVVVGCTSCCVRQSVREGITASGVDNAASPRLAVDTAERGLFHPQREADLLCKNNWKEPRSILMSSADRVAHTDGQTHAIIVSITTMRPAEYKCSKVLKTEQSIYECLLVAFNNIFCAATNFGCIGQFFFASNSRNEEMMG